MKKLPDLLRYFISYAVIVVFLCLGCIADFYIPNEFALTTIPIFCLVLFISMPEAIFHPQKHKLAWAFFTIAIIWALSLLAGNSSFGLHELREFFCLAMGIPAIIFFFLDRSNNNDKKNSSIKLRRSIFFMVATSITYAIPVYFYGIHGHGFDGIFPLLLLPIYLASLCVWIYRGWIKGKGNFAIAITFAVIGIFWGCFFLICS